MKKKSKTTIRLGINLKHPVYYSQTLRDGSLIAIWSDLTLLLFLLIGFITSTLSLKSPFGFFRLLFAIRAYLFRQISIYEIEFYLDDTTEVMFADSG